MNYKASLFNNFVYTDNGDLLVFNAYIGTKTIGKVRKEHVNEFLKRIKSEDISQEFSNKDLQNFLERGYIIDASEDELEKIKYTYNSIVNGTTLNITIILTRNCNFRCKYCYESFKNQTLSDDVCNNIVKFVRKNINRYSGLHVSWFGGEPLLCVDTIKSLSEKFIKICSVAKKLYTSRITTNGFLLDYSLFSELIKYHVYKYQITIDGVREVHDANRVLANGKGTFDKIIKNICDIRENNKSQLFSFVIRTNFGKKSIPHISKYVELLENIISNDQRFSLFIRTVSYYGGGDEVAENNADNISDYLDRGIIFNKVHDSMSNLQLDTHYGMLQTGMCMCYSSLNNHFVLDVDGVIRKCTCNLDDEKNEVGYLCDDGSIKYNYSLLNQWTGKFTEKEECLKCSFLPICMQKNCPATSIYNLNVGCPYEKLELDTILKSYDKTNTVDYIYER